MNKKGFLATIFLALLIAAFLIVVFFYFKLRTSGLEFTTGNIIVNLKYNDTAKEAPEEVVGTGGNDALVNGVDVNNTMENDSYDNSNITVVEINSSETQEESVNLSQQ